MADDYEIESGAGSIVIESKQQPGDEHRQVVEIGSGDVGTAGAKPIAEIFFGFITVATSGTRVVLGSTQALTNGMTVTAHPDNTGAVVVGKSNVTTTNAKALGAGVSDFIPVNDIADLFVDALNDGDIVTFTAW